MISAGRIQMISDKGDWIDMPGLIDFYIFSKGAELSGDYESGTERALPHG